MLTYTISKTDITIKHTVEADGKLAGYLNRHPTISDKVFATIKPDTFLGKPAKLSCFNLEPTYLHHLYCPFVKIEYMEYMPYHNKHNQLYAIYLTTLTGTLFSLVVYKDYKVWLANMRELEKPMPEDKDWVYVSPNRRKQLQEAVAIAEVLVDLACEYPED